MGEKKCVFCGVLVDSGGHHLVAQTLHGTIPNLSESDKETIKEIKIPVCRDHHELLEEQIRVYSHIIRCLLENRPYNFAQTLAFRKEQIMKHSENIRKKGEQTE